MPASSPKRAAVLSLALLHHLVAIDKLNGLRPGVTVNIGRIEGGTQPNVVAEHALRRARPARLAQRRYPSTAGCHPPAVAAACAAWHKCHAGGDAGHCDAGHGAYAGRGTAGGARAGGGEELGFTVKGASTGGASDASFVAAEGIPVLDGLGPIGGLDHSPDEYIELDSIVPRTALLAKLIAGVCA